MSAARDDHAGRVDHQPAGGDLLHGGRAGPTLGRGHPWIVRVRERPGRDHVRTLASRARSPGPIAGPIRRRARRRAAARRRRAAARVAGGGRDRRAVPGGRARAGAGRRIGARRAAGPARRRPRLRDVGPARGVAGPARGLGRRRSGTSASRSARSARCAAGTGCEITTYRADAYDRDHPQARGHLRRRPRGRPAAPRLHRQRDGGAAARAGRSSTRSAAWSTWPPTVLRTPGTPGGVLLRRPAADDAGGPVRRPARVRGRAGGRRGDDRDGRADRRSSPPSGSATSWSKLVLRGRPAAWA